MSPAAPGEDAHVDGNTIYIEKVLFNLHKRMHMHILISLYFVLRSNPGILNTCSASLVKLDVSSVDDTLWSAKLT